MSLKIKGIVLKYSYLLQKTKKDYFSEDVMKNERKYRDAKFYIHFDNSLHD